RGALQGLQSFKWLTINRVGERIVLLVAGSILVSLGFGIAGVMAALGIAGIAMLALAFVPLRVILRNSVSSTDWKELVFKGAPVLVTVLGIALLANVDLVMAKRFLPSEDAGLYSAIARTGRIVFFISVAFSRALFPKASRAQALGRSPASLIVRSLGYIGAFCVAAIIAAAVIGRPLIGIVYGDEYKEIAFLLPWYIGAVSLLSVTTVMMYYNLSLALNRHLIPLIATVVLQMVLLTFFHDSPLQIVIILILSITPLFLVNVIMQFSWRPSAKRLPVNVAEGDD
ncbi:MAG: oligosaccharide flippase family protein, partial [Chloroflexi bacterium]|nr:oligosaccharide flippase family protein [Chloroflexota bacterium]